MMDAWKGRVALVTGASSGMGLATAELLAKNGMIVVGCARNIQTINELQTKLGPDHKLLAIECDVTKESQIQKMMAEIKEKFGNLDVLVNNAGMGGSAPLNEGPTEEWQQMLQLNVFGLSVCAKEAMKLMCSTKDPVGHVININSYLGHHMVHHPGGHFYSATKHMVTALSDALRKEVQNSHIRVTNLSPGITETQFAARGVYKNSPEEAKKAYTKFKCLEALDVANAVVYILSVPPHVNIDELTMTAQQQKLI